MDEGTHPEANADTIGTEAQMGRKDRTMKIFKVGFKSSVCYSVNMIWANTGKEEREAVEETAARRAERYGYKVAFVSEISEAEAESNIRRGMPYYSIDEQAERDHDTSFATEAETETTESTEGGEESAPAFTIARNDEHNGTAVEVREIIDPDGIHKRTIAKSGTAYIVTFFELMGGRWVPLSSPERWSSELVQELVEA